MNLLLSSLSGLRQLYGDRETRRVMEVIDGLFQARAARGIHSRLLLFDEGLPDLGVAGAASDPVAIAAQIGAVAAALERGGDQIESVLIVGGSGIVPFELAPNPAQYDGDAFVPSDNIYGARERGGLLPEWPVGRLPGSEGERASADLLVRLLRSATQIHGSGPRDRFAKTFGMSTEAWRAASEQVYHEVSDAPLQLSPPVVAATLNRAALDGAGLVYCNLHGVRDGPVWYGQAEGAMGYLVALRPEDVLAVRLHGALVLSEACYGAALAGRDTSSSFALAFLARGAACFIGATAMSYGPASAPLSEADLLALHFWRVVRQGGTTIGTAFLEARAHMLIEMLDRQNALDENDQKTALEFVLYGDPTIEV